MYAPPSTKAVTPPYKACNIARQSARLGKTSGSPPESLPMQASPRQSHEEPDKTDIGFNDSILLGWSYRDAHQTVESPRWRRRQLVSRTAAVSGDAYRRYIHVGTSCKSSPELRITMGADRIQQAINSCRPLILVACCSSIHPLGSTETMAA